MVERAGILTEEDARAKIKTVLERLQRVRNIALDVKDDTDSSSVEYHIDKILKAGGGIWNETIAKDYLQNLEAQIGPELNLPRPS